MHPTQWFLAVAALGLLSACGGGGSGGGGGGGGGAAASSGYGVNNGAPLTSSVSGAVVDQDGLPLAGVTISAFHHNDHTTRVATTDANGRYTVAGLDTMTNADYAIYAAKSGYGFAASVGDAAGTVTKFDFNGLYRSVIRFAAMPAHNVSGADFTALRAGNKMVALARTGQSVSHANGDDASAQRGVAWPATRYTDNSDGTVTDHLTGLVWLKNAGCLAPGDWASALAAAGQLKSGACGLSDGSTAGQWRLPNVNELESLVDVAQARPALSSGHPFKNVSLITAYWSSTTYTAGTANAMAIRFTDGRWINGIDPDDANFSNAKTTSANSFWAVRSGSAGTVKLLATGVYSGIGGRSFGAGDDPSLQVGVALTSARFIDNGDGTVADTMTGLIWLKKADCINQAWGAALDTVNHLASGQCGLSDGSTAGSWRMPNRAEMLSLSDRAPTFPQASYFNGQYQGTATINGPAIFDNFVVWHHYWTSTTDAADTTRAWTLYSCDFGVYDMPKSDVRYSLAVR